MPGEATSLPTGAADGPNQERFATLWMRGASSERILGMPRGWDGREAGVDSFIC